MAEDALRVVKDSSTIVAESGAAGSRIAAVDPTVQVLRPVKRRLTLRVNWESRHVAMIIAIRDIKAQFKQSFLGPVWMVIQPLGMLAGFAVVFSGVRKVNDTHGVPYLLFALVGLAVWSYLQNVFINASNSQVKNRDLIRRFICPRVAFTNGALIFSLPAPTLMLATAVVGVAINSGLPLQAVLLPVMIVWTLLLAWGCALALAAVTARYRDTISMLPFIFQAGVFLSPVAYPASAAPHSIRAILSLNPATGLLETWRWALLGTHVAVVTTGIAVAWTVVFVVGGWRLFTRMEARFADYI